jgi:actin-like protein 6B
MISSLSPKFVFIYFDLFVDEVGALVFDIGHYALRAGYAGEDSPKAQIPSVVGVLEQAASVEMMDVDRIKEAAPASEKKYFIDTVALNVAKQGSVVQLFLLSKSFYSKTYFKN